jgi:hypothetical protein
MAPWQAFRECGWPAYAVLFLALVGLAAGAVALAMAAARVRLATAAAAVALTLSLGAAAFGPIGTLLQRRAVAQIVDGEAVDPSYRGRILEAGYAEAAQCTSVGLGAGVLPILLAGASLGLALAGRGGRTR